MGGFIDYEIGFDTKTSSHLIAIEKAQEELRRHEYDSREQRKRELEFLEKGGNPLDFKFGRAASISLQSTSFTEQQAKQCVISEAKGSFALSASHRGDSVESNGRPGGTVSREPNIVDNLLLFDEENSNAGRETNIKQSGYRGSCPNANEIEDSLIFHLGVKRQAYTRRNRSRSNRDNHTNKSTLPSSFLHHMDTKRPTQEFQAENHGVSVSTSKLANPDATSILEVPASNNQVDSSRLSDMVGKDEVTSVGFCSVSLEPKGKVKDTSIPEGDDSSRIPCKNVKNVHVLDGDLNRNKCVSGSTAEENANGGNANNGNCGMVRSTEVKLSGESKEISTFQRTSDNNFLKENSLLIGNESPNNNTILCKDEVELCDMGTHILGGVKSVSKSLSTNSELAPNLERKVGHSLVDSSVVVPTCEPSTTALSKTGPETNSAIENSAGNALLVKKACEDEILKKARIIEANLKRARQLSTSDKPPKKQRKCHWDFVLEEMAWMAYDFMQERLWKRAAAAHLCHRVASNGRTKFEQKNVCRKQRDTAKILANAVMHFWQSVDVSRASGETHNHLNEESNSVQFRSLTINGTTPELDQGSKNIEVKNVGFDRAIQAYAVRFLKYDCNTSNHRILAEAPHTPDRINDGGILDISMEDEISEERLFYMVPSGAMQKYREAMELQWVNDKKMDNATHQEDCEASLSDSLPDGPRENEYEEEQGETGSYASTFTYMKRNNFQLKSYASRQYDSSTDFPYDPYMEGKLVNPGKRPSSTLNTASIPIKRVRTTARVRVVNSFCAGASGSLPINNKTDVSNGDTNSFQEDQSSMHGGPHTWEKVEVESTVNFERQLPFKGSEAPTKFKLKKSKHFGYSINHSGSGNLVVSGKGSIIDQRLQADSSVQNEQKDQLKKRLESQYFEPNGKTAPFGQPAAKKPKLSKQRSEPSPDGLMSSPAASQISNIFNQNKLMKLITNRDRGKKSRAIKIAAEQSDSGISWTTFEDQALVVLVHDMGPNWELVSDAINGTLQFKCIFRKPKECMERHNFLIDKSASDGADSAEDSGSSQPYPSTLPGIPKESAGQLFQHLQGPMMENTLKAHFEKIILIGKKLHSCRSQKDTLKLKQLTPIHNSHVVTLSQVCPNNMSGGVLSPLDLCNAICSSPDVITSACQGSHANGAALANHQGSPLPVLPTSNATSNANTLLQGSSGGVLGSNISPSPIRNPPTRDAQRYSGPRVTSLPTDDQQRVHYAHMLSGRNAQQSSISIPGPLHIGVDQARYLLPGNNGRGMMDGRTVPRSGFEGKGSLGMPMGSPGSMLAGGGVHPGPVSIQGNSMFKPRDALRMVQPGQNTDDCRQAKMEDLRLQGPQRNAQSMPSFNALSASFSVQSYPPQNHQQLYQMPQQPHGLGTHHHPHIQGTINRPGRPGPQHRSFAVRLAKERRLQQQIMPKSQSSSPSKATSTIQNISKFEHGKQQIQPNQVTKQRPKHQQQQKQQILQQQSKLIKGHFSGGSGLNTTSPHSSNPHQLYSHPPSQTSKQMSLPSDGDALLSSAPLATPQPHQQQQCQGNQNMERMIYSSRDQSQISQIARAKLLPKFMDPTGSAQKPEGPYDSSTPSSMGQLAGSAHENLLGTETVVPSSSEGSELRQLSKSMPQQQPRLQSLQVVQGNLPYA